MSRPAIADERLELTGQGHVHYRLKTSYRDGTTRVLLDPLDLLARLAALVPLPRVQLTRYHGVFAPASALRGGRLRRRPEGKAELRSALPLSHRPRNARA